MKNYTEEEMKKYQESINIAMIDYLKKKKAEYERKGQIPTLELLIEDLEAIHE